MELRDRIDSLLNDLLPICESWIQGQNGDLRFVDPNDGEEISAHYGATHMAAALILRGIKCGQSVMYQEGISLLNCILSRWELNSRLPSFHFDFNNFALCVVADIIENKEPVLYERLKQIVLQTKDSNHSTTNWLPMRWFVNHKRYKWTNENKFKNKCRDCRIGIERATNKDGGIEDRMPKGLSFNLQYDVATVGVLQFLRQRGIEYNLSKELNFLLNAVAPDGDINYQGRGANQIFAWGPWIYLLASSGRHTSLEKSIDYLEPKVGKMFHNRNLMLNNYKGKDKYLWWDYHYCSVYCAHFVFWLVLAEYDFNRLPIEGYVETTCHDTGLHIYKTDEAFVAIFDGRKEYLAEQGPSICAIWTKKCGTIYKSSFGPWLGSFGQNYTNGIVLHNVFGIKKIAHALDRFYRLLPKPVLYRIGLRLEKTIYNNFVPINVILEGPQINLIFSPKDKDLCYLNIIVDESAHESLCVDLSVDGKSLDVKEVGSINTQYGNSKIFQSIPKTGKEWVLAIN